MGFKPSPYNVGRTLLGCLEYAKGEPDDPANPFGFVEVRLNLPMSADYDPTSPRVMKLDRKGRYAGEAVPYADDFRVAGRHKAHAKEYSRYCVSRTESRGVCGISLVTWHVM